MSEEWTQLRVAARRLGIRDYHLLSTDELTNAVSEKRKLLQGGNKVADENKGNEESNQGAEKAPATEVEETETKTNVEDEVNESSSKSESE